MKQAVYNICELLAIVTVIGMLVASCFHYNSYDCERACGIQMVQTCGWFKVVCKDTPPTPVQQAHP